MYAITDTHALLWYLLADPRLSVAAHEAFTEAAKQGNPIGVPTICLVEVIYLTEKGRIPLKAFTALDQAINTPGSILLIVPLDQQIALSIRQIDRALIPDLPDRIIAATAHCFKLALITRDSKIQASGITTIW